MSISEKYLEVVNTIKTYSLHTTLIIVTKNQDLQRINLLINKEHLDFGENKVQEATLKWASLILRNPKLKLHLIGKLQSNKIKDAFKIFHYVHTLDNEKLAQIFSKLEKNSSKKIKYFVQVNIANEPQKNGISINLLNPFIKYCVNDLKLNIIGLMCIPPAVGDPTNHFKVLAELAKLNHLNELSMGMSNDYEIAIKNGATFVRVGSKIFSKS
jgi:pyridoxal phosphate enzyme (YggS family)